MNPLEPLIERFKDLSHRYQHGRHDLQSWNAAHKELFQLAQAIATHGAPSIQRELTLARRALIPYIEKPEMAIFDDTALVAVKVRKYRWSDFQITPEIHINMHLTGARIPRQESLRLIKAHRLQVRYVLEIIGR